MRNLRLAAGSLAVLAFAGVVGVAPSASAADIPVKAPRYAPAVWDWSGFYIGVNAGGSIGRVPTQTFVGTNNSGAFNISPAGFIGGGQVGYNYQITPHLLVGVEGDFQGASQKDSSCLDDACPAGGPGSITAEQKLDWFATARARLGFTKGDWLWYVTGGGAWARVHNDFVITPSVGTGAVSSVDANLSGWTVGGGVETHIAGPWSAKLEYLYMNLGSFANVAQIPNGTTFTMTSDVRDHIVRAGVNYKLFGGGDSALRARASAENAYAMADAWSWTGFYIGVNAGGTIGRVPVTQANATDAVGIAAFTMSPAGFIGGAQVGYNYQFATNWVVGVEGDFQGAGLKDSSCAGTGCGLPLGFAFFFQADQSLKWFATARGRVGYANGDWLWYVTGGGAWAKVHNDFFVFTPLDAAGSADFNLHGWALGGGVETHVWGGWTAKLEYLYLDLGSFVDVVVDTFVTRDTYTMTSDVRNHIVRVGLNYKFN
jgi:outer membrane immunogenic protein